jgi:hypothetical protein
MSHHPNDGVLPSEHIDPAGRHHRVFIHLTFNLNCAIGVC